MKPGDKVMYRLPTRKSGWSRGIVVSAHHVETLKGHQWRGDLYRVRMEDASQDSGMLFYRDELLSRKEWGKLVNENK